jgi:hypothetical protein
MKPVIVTLVFLCAGNICNAQSQKEKFITYGLQKDRAETAAARGEHAQAMAIYDSAFATLPFLGYDYYDAVLNALEAGSDERANNLLIQGTENGLVVEGLYDSTIISFLQSERCMPYLNMRDYMKACWLSRADTAKIRKMKELGSWWVMIEDANGNLTKQKASTAYDRLWVFVKEKENGNGPQRSKWAGNRNATICSTCCSTTAWTTLDIRTIRSGSSRDRLSVGRVLAFAIGNTPKTSFHENLGYCVDPSDYKKAVLYDSASTVARSPCRRITSPRMLRNRSGTNRQKQPRSFQDDQAIDAPGHNRWRIRFAE